MHDLLQKRVKVSESATPTGANGPVVLTTTGDKYILSPGNPVQVLRWGVILNAAKDASALVMTLETRPTAGSDTNRVVSDTLTDTATARAAGILLERTIVGTNPNQSTGSDGNPVNVGPLANDGILAYPGQELVVKVGTAAASTGSGYIYMEYVEKPSAIFYNYAVQPTSPVTTAYTVVQL